MFQEKAHNGRNTYAYLDAEVLAMSLKDNVDVLQRYANAMNDADDFDVSRATNDFVDATLCGIATPEDNIFGDPYLSAINCDLGENIVPPHSSFHFVRDFDSAIGICKTLPLSGSLAVAAFPKLDRSLTKPIHLDVPAFVDVCHASLNVIRCIY